LNTYDIKAFTTERKPKPRSTINIAKKGSIVKERCKQLVEILLQLYPEGIVPEEDVAYFIARYIGADRNTIRAYLGFKGSIATNKRTGEGYVRGIQRKGYLEIFGFMHRINRNTWFIPHQTEITAYQNEKAVTVPNTYEANGENCSKEKISLSHTFINVKSLQLAAVKEKVSVGETSVSPRTERHTEKTNIEAAEISANTENKINNNTSVRERNFTPKIGEDLGTPYYTNQWIQEAEEFLTKIQSATLNANQKQEGETNHEQF
jgi:hypothetical protein